MPATDYAKWDAMAFSDDEDEKATAPGGGVSPLPFAAPAAELAGGGAPLPEFVYKTEKLSPAMVDPPEMSLDNLSCTLDLEMDRAPKPRQGILLNRFEEAGAKVLSAKMAWPASFDGDGLNDLSEAEMDYCALKKDEMTLVSHGASYEKSFKAPNGMYFSVRDALLAIADFESVARQHSNWFGGPDTHHVFFEGLHAARGGSNRYTISWGS